jgi:hypothetical protein
MSARRALPPRIDSRSSDGRPRFAVSPELRHAPAPAACRRVGEMVTSRESEAAERELMRRLRNSGAGKRYCVYGHWVSAATRV